MNKCPGCQEDLPQDAAQCAACGMRFDQEELRIDWGAIDSVRRRQERTIKHKILPFILWLSSVAMLVWLASPYVGITDYIRNQDAPVDFRAYLKANNTFPEPDTYVKGVELTLGYKGAEWRRIRRFDITRQDVVYIQVIGAVCPYEMPRENCRKVLIEAPKETTDFDSFRPASAITVEGRLHRITATSEFAPLIPFLAREMHLDAEGAYVIAHGVHPKLGKDGWTFWGVVGFVFLVLLGLLYRLWRK